MSTQRKHQRSIIAALSGVLALACAGLPAAPASAEGFFQALFGALHRARTPPPSLTDPFGLLRSQQREAPRSYVASGPAQCVRTCDGMHFPLSRASGNPTEMCEAFCPASPTKVFYGSTIDNAVAADGTRYADSDNAFVYRDHIVSNCTCNGKNPFGLAKLPAQDDPTLRPGDMVATSKGLVAFTGGRNGSSDFTPIAQYGSYPKGYREKLSEMKIAPPAVQAETTGSIPPSAQAPPEDHRSVQLWR